MKNKTTAIIIDKNKQIQSMILSGKYSCNKIINFINNKCKNNHLTPQTLGMLFEMYAGVKYDENDAMSCFSAEITMDELIKIHSDFQSTNGCQWARSDTSYLGKRYIIIRKQSKGRVSSVKLDGINNKSIKKHRNIKKEIYDNLSKKRCVVLDVGQNIEIDHKDGHYDVLTNLDTSTQKESDFQPLSKAANDAKRTHCSNCKKTGKRYDARTLGYCEGFIAGDENTKSCQGCYWYDPIYFNKVISGDFNKTK